MLLVGFAIGFDLKPSTPETTTRTLTSLSTLTQTASSPQRPSTTTFQAANVTFKDAKWPQNFALGQYSLAVLTCGPPCEDETFMNTGSEVNFTVAYSDQTQVLSFGWPPMLSTPDQLPGPSMATVYDGGITVSWFTNSTGLYVNVSTSS